MANGYICVQGVAFPRFVHETQEANEWLRDYWLSRGHDYLILIFEHKSYAVTWGSYTKWVIKKIPGKQHFSKSVLTSLPYSYQKERILRIRSKLIRNCLRVHGITEKNLHVYLVRKVHFSLPMSSICSHFSPLQPPVSARGCSPWFTSPDWERCGQTRLLWAIRITGQIRGTQVR